MKTKIKNVLSLFGGIECGRLALQRAGIEPENYFSSEVDKYAIQVVRGNWHDVQHIGDVRDVRASDLPKIDLLIGGSPCQGFSFAGKMLNFKDPRSALFFEFVRILNEVRETNPDVLFMLENVPMKREHEMVISKYLGVEPITINAALVSAQNRKRLFWTNIKAQPFNLFGDKRSTIRQPADKKIMLKDVLQPESEVDEKYFLNQRRTDFMLKKQGKYTQLNGEKCMTVTSRADAGWQGDFIFIEHRGRGNNPGGKRAMNGKTPSVSTSNWEHNNHLGAYRRLTPVEVERLFTLPDGYTAAVSDSQRYRLMGNGWVSDVIVHILSHIE